MRKQTLRRLFERTQVPTDTGMSIDRSGRLCVETKFNGRRVSGVYDLTPIEVLAATSKTIQK